MNQEIRNIALGLNLGGLGGALFFLANHLHHLASHSKNIRSKSRMEMAE